MEPSILRVQSQKNKKKKESWCEMEMYGVRDRINLIYTKYSKPKNTCILHAARYVGTSDPGP